MSVKMLNKRSMFYVLIALMCTCFVCLALAESYDDKAVEKAKRDLNAAEKEMNEALAKNKAEEKEELKKLNDQADPRVLLELRYPVGRSPKVFTKGWIFDAHCLYIADPKTDNAEPADISSQVRWEGSGSFSPSVGKKSSPSFSTEGRNTIILSVNISGKKITKTYHINAVSPAKYARVGSIAHSPADAHGCPDDPKDVKGPVSSGSPNVLIEGKPAARVGDTGKHCCCCGPNTFVIETGNPEVLIDGKPAARIGDKTRHCGGMGTIVSNK